MMTLVQNSATPHPASSENPSTYILAASNLPNNSVIPIYLQNRVVTFTDRNTKESYKTYCISFLRNLNTETSVSLKYLIENKRIGALHIENHTIKSLTLSQEIIDIFNKFSPKGVTLEEKEEHFVVDSNPIIRSFISDEQYIKFAARLF